MRIKRNVSNIGYAANYVTYDPPPPSQFTATHWVYLPLVTYFYFNGDFEAGPRSWSQYSEKNWELIMNLEDYSSLGLYNHQGNYAAWLGGDYSETSIISQQLTIPSTVSRLGYWYWIDSVDSCGYDFAYVEFAGTRLKSYDLCYLRIRGVGPTNPSISPRTGAEPGSCPSRPPSILTLIYSAIYSWTT